MPTVPGDPSNARALDLARLTRRGGRTHHAYVVSGRPLEGLMAFARCLEHALVCLKPNADATPCNACAGCRKAQHGVHPDMYRLAPNDKHVIAIDQVRKLTGRLGMRASLAIKKLVRIEAADAMPVAAQNALLKTLEEPPGDTLFLLLCTRPKALLATVRSRCLSLRLPPLDTANARQCLQEAGIAGEDAPLLAALCGADTAMALQLADKKPQEIFSRLCQHVRPDANLGSTIRLAADLGADRAMFDLSLGLLELMVHHSLASQGTGCPAPLGGVWPGDVPVPAAALAAGAAAHLQRLRRTAHLHVNRAMALESVFFALRGAVAP